MNYIIRLIIGTIWVLLALYGCASFDKSLKSYTMPPNVEQYFRDKYKDQVDEVKCDFQETSHGPKGHLSLKGRIDLNRKLPCQVDSLKVEFLV